MKTTNAHSPGPWQLGVRQPTSDKFIYGSRGEEIADCDRKTNFADENLANARLIAAAPELLAALKEAQGTLLHNGIDTGPLPGVSQRIRLAISKAEGQT